MWKNLLLAGGSLVLFAALIEGALALVGVQTALEKRDPFLGFASQIPLFQEAPKGGARGRLVTAPGRRSHFNTQRFTRIKSPGTERVFCLGGSTTYGRPYDDTSSFCGWLRVLLPLVDSSRTWEVVNAGGISYASYRVANLMEELVGYEPDWFAIYTGHNEFLERRTYPDLIEQHRWLMDARLMLYRTRSYGLLSDALAAARGRGNATPASDALPGEVEAILDRSAGLAYYKRDELNPETTLVHFHVNLERIIDKARAAGAEVILVRPGSNLRGLSPFKSEQATGLAPERLREFRDLMRRAREASANGSPEAAVELLDTAIAIDPRHAGAHFLRGRALYALERHEESQKAFERARDEDVVTLRAPSAFGAEVSRVASESGVPLIDFETLVASHAEHGIPGADVFLDHVHPTIEMNGRLAVALAETITAAQRPSPDGVSPVDAFPEARRIVDASVDLRAHGLAQKNLAKVLHWAGKNEEAYLAAERSIAQIGSWHWESHSVAASIAVTLKDVDAAIEHSRASLRLLPNAAEEHSRLGQLLAHRGEYESAVEHLELALANRPNFAEAHWVLGNALVAMDRHPESLRHYAAAARLEPSAAHSASLGVALLRAGRLEAARAELENAMQRDPANAEAAVALAELHARAGRRSAAETWAERGLFLARKRGNAELEQRARIKLQEARSARRRPPGAD
jgi:tetratricopeptide (TPR) repeat protein